MGFFNRLLKAATLSHVGGVFLGSPMTVVRNIAMPEAPAPVLREWASEQGRLLSASKIHDAQKIIAAAVVMAFGGEIGTLPIVERGGEFLSREQLIGVIRDTNEVLVYGGVSIDFDEDSDDVHPRDFKNSFEQSSEIFLLPDFEVEILKIGNEKWPACVNDLLLAGPPHTYGEAFQQALAKAWGKAPDSVDDVRTVGTVLGSAITRTVEVFTR